MTKSNRIILSAVFALIAVVSCLSMYYHEVWLDEAHAFLIARDSIGVHNLFLNIRYEGHPALWHILLYYGYRLTHSIYVMQAIHLTFGLATIAIILACSPFNIKLKLMLACSYFFSYEYLIISRNYTIGIFFIVLSMVVFKRMRGSFKLVIVAVLIGLAMNSHVSNLLISTFLFICMLAIYLKEPINRNKNAMAACLIIIIALATAYSEIRPFPDRSHPKPDLSVNPAKILNSVRRIGQVVFLVPTNRWSEPWSWTIPAIGSAPLEDIREYQAGFDIKKVLNLALYETPSLLLLLLIGSLLLLVRKSLPVMIFFALSLGGLFFFDYVFYPGTVRHLGYFFILIIITLWLFKDFGYKDERKSLDKKIFVYVFSIVLLLQLVSSVVFHVCDYLYIFSDAKNTAEFLKKQKLTNKRILFSPEYMAPQVLYYSGIKKAFYPETKKYQSFIVFSNSTRQVRDGAQILKLAQQENSDVLVFLQGYPTIMPSDSLFTANHYHLQYKTSDVYMLTNERYLIYVKDTLVDPQARLIP